MWRSFLLAFGISLCILGGECLVLDRVILADSRSSVTAADYQYYSGYFPTTSRRIVVPPEWAPWALLSTGSIVILYACSVARGDGG